MIFADDGENNAASNQNKRSHGAPCDFWYEGFRIFVLQSPFPAAVIVRADDNGVVGFAGFRLLNGVEVGAFFFRPQKVEHVGIGYALNRRIEESEKRHDCARERIDVEQHERRERRKADVRHCADGRFRSDLKRFVDCFEADVFFVFGSDKFGAFAFLRGGRKARADFGFDFFDESHNSFGRFHVFLLHTFPPKIKILLLYHRKPLKINKKSFTKLPDVL